MWIYEKRLQYPVKIKKPDARMAKYILSRYGGPDGEMAASLRYLSQRFAMPTDMAKGVLNDIGTEEMAHLEMVGSIVYQLTKDMSPKELEASDYGAFFVDHAKAIYAANAAGVPFSAAYFQSKGDPIADLTEDLAAEQKARATYDNILKMADDPDVIDPIKFLREREIVHFQRFGETLRHVEDKLKEKPFIVKKPL